MDKSVINRIKLASYVLFFLCLLGVRSLGMATPLITVLFSYFALETFHFYGRKWLAILIFILFVIGIISGLVAFGNAAIDELPNVISDSIPRLTEFSGKYNINLPFTDLESLKALAAGSVREQLGYIGNFAKTTTKEFVTLIIGIVIAISIFIDSKFDHSTSDYRIRNNLYTILGAELVQRFRNFYFSFRTVMGAQIIISAINTALTGIFILALGLPYFQIVLVATFLCGLLPIIGNIISNTIIFLIATKLSVYHAIGALVFLVLLHKLEYFLNSKIIGGKIKNPMWLTLIALIVGETVMGVPGMILAPVILQLLKLEGSQIEVAPSGLAA